MLDDSGDFVGVAQKEMKEETGIEVKEKDMVDLIKYTGLHHDRGLYASVGGCDEFLKFFLCEHDMSQNEISKLQGKLTGNMEEGESIKIKIVLLKDLADTCPDMKTMTALYLYRRLQIRRKLDDDAMIRKEMEDEASYTLIPIPPVRRRNHKRPA
jgi:ADP-sugar diphosphatase